MQASKNPAVPITLLSKSNRENGRGARFFANRARSLVGSFLFEGPAIDKRPGHSIQVNYPL